MCGGRLDVGRRRGLVRARLRADRHGACRRRGSGWPGCARRSTVPRDLLGGGPFTFDGRYHRASGALNEPGAVQQPPPPIIVGGKGDRLLALVAELADGWNTCWVWTPDAYRERSACSSRACERSTATPRPSPGRSASTRCAGRTSRPRAALRAPPGPEPARRARRGDLDEWREGRLVGTVEQVREQAAGGRPRRSRRWSWGSGAVPFAVTTVDDLELRARALREQTWTPDRR